jgi:hypothetical protein
MVIEMTLESETLFVVGESDELVCHSSNQSMVISGLKGALLESWGVSMTNEILTVLELVTKDVGKFAATRLFKGMGQSWIKFDKDRFLASKKLKSAVVSVDTSDRRVMISLAFDCLPVTFEQAVSISLAQKGDDRPRLSGSGEFGERLRSQLKKTFRSIPDPNTVVGGAGVIAEDTGGGYNVIGVDRDYVKGIVKEVLDDNSV